MNASEEWDAILSQNCAEEYESFASNCQEIRWDNSTSNGSLEGDNPYYFYETEQFTFLWILFVFIVAGNSAVIGALMLSKSRKSRTNFFIMHLALADLSVGLISVLTDIIWKITVSWNAGNIACKIVRFAQGLVTYSSTYVLVALSIDRYDAITHPMKFSGSWTRARNLVRIAWLLSIFLASPSLFLFKEAEVKGVPQCWMQLTTSRQWQVYMVLVSFAVLIIPTCVITACYAIIVETIWSKSKMMTMGEKSSHSSAQNGRRFAPSHADEDTRRASSRGLIPKAKIKTVKMTFVIVFVFVLCWAPYIVFDLLQVFGHIPQTQTNIALATFIQSLAPLNSAANPIIYCLFSTRICRNLRRIRALDQMVQVLCPCCNCTKQPLGSHVQWPKSGTELTTMSEASAKRHQASSVHNHGRYFPVRQAVAVCQGSPHVPISTTSTTGETVNVELLALVDAKDTHHRLIKGSAV